MPTPSELIDELIKKTPDWRGELIAAVRKNTREADPEIIEEWKWMGSPTFSRNGVICVVTLLKDKVKVTFNDGAQLADPDKGFNNGLDGNKWRAIDMKQGYKLDEKAFRSLIKAGAEFNLSKPAKKK